MYNQIVSLPIANGIFAKPTSETEVSTGAALANLVHTRTAMKYFKKSM
jgi:hypothetical protein